MRRILYSIVLTGLVAAILVQCQAEEKMKNSEKKVVIYQVLPRLFGNQERLNKPWGTIEENGVGKFNDFTDRALQDIKDLGVTHIWYTGVLHHCVIRDYTAYGISNDDPDVVKGRAGSPYAVKDYYNVNPDLAQDPSRRLEEF
jgi:glycosidase